MANSKVLIFVVSAAVLISHTLSQELSQQQLQQLQQPVQVDLTQQDIRTPSADSDRRDLWPVVSVDRHDNTSNVEVNIP